MLAHPVWINRPIVVTLVGRQALPTAMGGIRDAPMRVVVNPYMGTLSDVIVWVHV